MNWAEEGFWQAALDSDLMDGLAVAEKELKEIMERNKMKWDFVESVEFEGAPKEEDLVKVEVSPIALEKMKEKVVE